MRILIVVDEPPAAKRLQSLLQQLRPNYEICGILDSVQAATEWLEGHSPPGLALFDIQLADGLSFNILQQDKMDAPVIFTTAYDQYTLKAFKHNSVDYLLKPVDPAALEKALVKYEKLHPRLQAETIKSLMESFIKPSFKSRFIIKVGQQLTYIATGDIKYFYSEDGIVYAQRNGRKRHAIDYTLDALGPQLDPQQFFRLNRKLISNIEAIQSVAPYFNGRLLVKLSPPAPFEVTVSRDRASDFKAWLGA